MKKISKIFLSSALVPLLITLTIGTNSCSVKKIHSSCNKTSVETISTANFTIELDANNYAINNFDIALSGNDADKLLILDAKIIGNTLNIYIKPKEEPSNDRTTYNFNLNLTCFNKWTESHRNLALIYRVVADEIKFHDDNAWQHTIEYIANCKHPTIYWNSSTPLGIEEITSLYLSSSFLAQSLGHTYENPEYIYNDNICLEPFNHSYQYKTSKIMSYFPYQYGSLISEDLGLKDILKYGINNANNMLLTNLQDFDTSLADYDETRQDYSTVDNLSGLQTEKEIDGHVKILDKIYSLYPEETKFNFVFVEADIASFVINSKPQFPDVCADLLTKIFQKADKIYCVSEGYGFIGTGLKGYYQTQYDQFGFTNFDDKKRVWDNIHTLPFNEARQIVKDHDLYLLWSNCPTFITYLSAANDVVRSLEYVNEDKFVTYNTMIKPSYTWFLLHSYKQILTQSYFEKFSESYLTFYNFFNGSTKTFSDYIFDTEDLPNNFSKNKKNIIFLLPAFMGTGDLSKAKLAFQDFKSLVDKVSIKYPFDEWNYIYKYHPRATTELIVPSLKAIFDGAIPNNTVVLKNKYPFEYLLALDNFLVETGIEDAYHLIDIQKLKSGVISGIMTGESINSTCVYNAMEMVVNESNGEITWDQAKKIIQYDAFFIPTKHKISSTDEGDYAEWNMNQIKWYWNKFYDVGQFIDPNNFDFLK